jgi:quercetin dioxygenase-like cupin family protein
LNNPKKSKQTQELPKVIKDLPEADLPFNGVKAWILQGEKQQLIFFEMEPIAKVPEHSHTYPQWGMVVEGQMKLTISDKTRLYKKGDEYLIPAQAKHSATFPTKARVMDFFQEKTRYKPKQKPPT